MTARGAIALVLLCGAAPALSGCVAVAIPALAGAMVAKKQVIDGKPKDASPPPREARVSVFAGEGSAKATLDPATVPGGSKPAGLVPTPAVLNEPVAAALPAIVAPPPPPQLAAAAIPSPAPAPAPAKTDELKAVEPAKTAAELIAPPPQSKPAVADSPLSAAAPPGAALLPPAPESRPAIATSTVAAPAPAKSRALVLPPPPVPVGSRSSGYLGFTSFALSHVNSPESDAVLDVIDPADPLAAPRRPQCGGLAPAVVIDLDPGLETFNPAANDPQPGLAEALAALRSAGITVMWASARPVEDAEKVHTALAKAGLDPARTDRLLLLKGAGDRKQARRLAAARNWCVIAMAGDRRGDFDEVFDYLKDADTQIPADQLFGDGWFIAPAPLP